MSMHDGSCGAYLVLPAGAILGEPTPESRCASEFLLLLAAPAHKEPTFLWGLFQGVKALQSPGALLHPLLPIWLQLMRDKRHHVRLSGAAFAGRVLLVSWENTAAIFEDVIQVRLCSGVGWRSLGRHRSPGPELGGQCGSAAQGRELDSGHMLGCRGGMQGACFTLQGLFQLGLLQVCACHKPLIPPPVVAYGFRSPLCLQCAG